MVKNWKQYNESFNIPGVKINEITVGLKPADKGHKARIASYFNSFIVTCYREGLFNASSSILSV